VGEVVKDIPATVILRTAEEDPVGIGLAVVRGAEDDGVHVPTCGGQDFFGVTVFDTKFLQGDHYAAGQELPVLVKGALWVMCLDGALPGDTVSFDSASGGLGVTVGDLVQNATWETTTAAGEIGIVFIR